MLSLYALTAAAASSQSMITTFLPFIAIGVIFYFLLIRPQQKRAREHKEMLSSLKKGDVVITQGGLVGKVTKTEDAEITLEISEGVRVKLVRGMILQLRTQVQPVAQKKKYRG